MLLLGFAGSVVAFWLDRAAEEQDVRDRFAFRADWRASDMAAKFESETTTILGATVLLATAAPTADEFAAYVRARVTYARGSPRVVLWSPRVMHADRAAFEAQARALGLADYAITEIDAGRFVPAAARPEYYPSLFLVDFTGQSAALGFDINSDDGRRAAIQRAIDSGRISGTPVAPRFAPGSALGQGQGLSVYAPVYESLQIPEDVADRRRRVRGIVGGSFDLERLLNDAIADTLRIVGEIYVLPPSASPNVPVAAYRPEQQRFVVGPSPVALSELPGVRIDRAIAVAGQTLGLVFHFPPNEVEALRTADSWAWLIGGILITLMAAGLVQALHDRARRLGWLVDKKSAEVFDLDAKLRDRLADLEAIIQAAPVGIAAMNTDRTIRIWSPAAERIYGFTAADPTGGRVVTVPRAEWPGQKAEIDRVLGGDALPATEYTQLRKDGAPIQVRLAGAPLRGHDGRVTGAIFVIEDITEQQATEAQLRHAQKMEAIGQLTGGIAHDFNNLLTIILGNLELLAPSLGGDERLRKRIDTAIGAVNRGADLTKRLLAFARRQVLNPKVMHLNEVVVGLEDLFRRTLGEDIDIKFALAPDGWPVRIDAAELEHALLNLATNARHAMPTGGQLTIETANVILDQAYAHNHAEVAPGEYAMVAVTDTGIGIPKELQRHVFEPFFTTKEKGKGTGLGLAMVYGFVKQSSGHAKVYSEPGYGTTVKLCFPRAEAEEPAAVNPADEKRHAPGGNETILVVEDEPEVREIAISALATLGYRVLAADSGPRALEALGQHPEIHLLFTDVVMQGGMNGGELARAAQARRPGLKVLFCSGYAQEGLARTGRLESGANLIAKPYQLANLTKKIRDILDG
ncbi:MAG: CHASE domain-containing protein [Pseudomonadota bacterium]